MTTAPKVSKFRIRRAPRTPAPAPVRVVSAAESLLRPEISDEAFGPSDQSPPVQAPAGTGEASDFAQTEAIKAEALTGRQLRMARRNAMKAGIKVESDHDAVRELRKRGLDPFKSTPALDLVTRNDTAELQLPERIAPATPPQPRPLNEGERVDEIMRIQRDIVRRRKRKLFMLLARLTVFVLLPTIVAGYYYFVMATPLYATKSAFVIQQSEAQSTSIGSLFRGTQFATSQDSIAVQSYLQSRDAMLRLDEELGFKAHFSQPFIDPIQRLPANASNEDAFKIYRRNVKIGFDPTEGIVKMEVIAADPMTSQRFSEALIAYAESQVDHLSSRLREDQMKGARDSFADAEAKVSEAQKTVLELQEKLGVLDPLSESSQVMGQISAFQMEAQKKRLELQQLLDNPQPNQARVEGARGDIARVETLIRELRGQLTGDSGNANGSLARITGQLAIAEADLQTRQMLLAAAMQQLETARIEANRQVRFLETSEPPIAPDEASYPRAFEDTLLALLIFSGIYLMLSLTASILREQATG